MADRLTKLAKNLRKQTTDTEQVLWKYLRAKRMYGFKFKRQQPIGKYIVAFVCFERKIIIELDGGQHTQPEQIRKDRERDRWFEQQGYEVLRYWDNEVLKNTREVLEVIWEKCLKHPPLNPLPSREGK
ncbi:MAG: endonuclease domain-containing protein [Nitrospirae bacterium]|nr:endonuclease domain-containing protein [Nitrospirota bacterium]